MLGRGGLRQRKMGTTSIRWGDCCQIAVLLSDFFYIGTRGWRNPPGLMLRIWAFQDLTGSLLDPGQQTCPLPLAKVCHRLRVFAVRVSSSPSLSHSSSFSIVLPLQSSPPLRSSSSTFWLLCPITTFLQAPPPDLYFFFSFAHVPCSILLFLSTDSSLLCSLLLSFLFIS